MDQIGYEKYSLIENNQCMDKLSMGTDKLNRGGDIITQLKHQSYIRAGVVGHIGLIHCLLVQASNMGTCS